MTLSLGSVPMQRYSFETLELLRQAAVKPDRAVVVVTHDNRVFHFGERIAHMDDGRIVQVEERAVASA